jgi:cytochrome c-type biogenesis protein
MRWRISMAEKLPIAFLAGLVSVITPCVLPLVPGYLSAVSAVEIDRLGERGVGRRIALASLPFIAGFTAVFVALGAGAAAVGSAVDKPTQIKIAGFVLVVIGLAFVGLLPWPERSVAPGLLARAQGRGSSALLGGAFAVCAAPCIGTVLASILVLASSSGTIVRGIVLLVAYSLGLGAAFVLAGVAFAHAMRAFRFVRDHYGTVRAASGVVLVSLGLLLFFGRDWWLQVALDQVFTRIGLGTL